MCCKSKLEQVRRGKALDNSGKDHVFLGYSLDRVCGATPVLRYIRRLALQKPPDSHLFAGTYSRLQRHSELPSSLKGKVEQGSELRFHGGADSCVGCCRAGLLPRER